MNKMSKKFHILSIRIEHRIDENPDLSFLGKYTNTWVEGCIEREINNPREYKFFLPATEYGQQDYQRMEDYNKNNWWMIGIVAKAQIKSPNGIIQTICSGSLWGIESDSDKEYIKQVEQEQLDGLKKELEAIGLGERAIEKAFNEDIILLPKC
jgi:hypothetical protein